MIDLVWLIPLFPLIGFFFNGLLGKGLPEKVIGWIGSLAVGASFVVAVMIFLELLGMDPGSRSLQVVVYTWVLAGNLNAPIGFLVDPLSTVMLLVVSGVGFIIHVYSIGYMHGEIGFRRYFAYLNLFVFAMLTLVSANNFLLMFVGWEGVGLCSYLLIGYYYEKQSASDAGKKAFVVNRVGDFGFLIGLFLTFVTFGTLTFTDVFAAAPEKLTYGGTLVTLITLLFFVGATGKSAQIPLYTWLPDAMEGPTPVSALIHAATMVTAGVYMVSRLSLLYAMAPISITVVAVIGGATAFYAATMALAQTDIKRVLAYSTISQIGYMFLALGVGAWSAAIFHLMVHAFFKALLFLAAGLVIKAMGGEHDIRKMGGLRRDLPAVFWTFLIGAASLSAVPVITAGFYSKDLIIGSALSSEQGSVWLWVAAVLGALLTSAYAFRLVFLVFFGSSRGGRDERADSMHSGKAVLIPVAVLAVLSVVGGWIQLPQKWASVSLFTDFLAPVLPLPAEQTSGFAASVAPQVLVMILSLTGIYSAYLLFLRTPAWVQRLAERPALLKVSNLALVGWGFDRFYSVAIVRPFLWLAREGKGDLIDRGFSTVAWSAGRLSSLLSRTQTGRVRYYVAAAALGVVAFVALGIFR